MSFVDLMGNVVWTEADIINRTESLVRAEFPVQSELILNRKMQGVAAGVYTLTPDEQSEVERFQAVCFAAQQEGVAARLDMTLLNEVLMYEQCVARLERETVAEDDPSYALDLAEREAAQEYIAATGQPVVDLAGQRAARG